MYIAMELKTRLVTVRTHNQIMKRLNIETMEHIRDEYWPKHFQIGPETYPGAGGYQYAKRTLKYEDRKFRKYGHRRPLVYTGALERSVRSTARISGTSRGARLRARSPHFLRVRNRKEIERVSKREQMELMQRYGREYVRLANLPEYQEFRLRKAGSLGGGGSLRNTDDGPRVISPS